MTQRQMIALVRKLIADEQATGFTEGGNLEQPEGTQELLNYLDRAVDEYSKRQAASQDLRLVKRMTVTDGMSVPDDFISFCGVVPLVVEGNIINYHDNITHLPVKYLSRLPYVTSYPEAEELPYDKDQYITIAALAAIYALNKHEYSVSQDLTLLGMGVQNGNVQQ